MIRRARHASTRDFFLPWLFRSRSSTKHFFSSMAAFSPNLFPSPSKLGRQSCLETHSKRQATQHNCLLSLLCDGDKGIELVYDEENFFFLLDRLEQPRQNEKLLVPARQDQRTKGPLHLYSLVSLVVPRHLSLNGIPRREIIVRGQSYFYRRPKY